MFRWRGGVQVGGSVGGGCIQVGEGVGSGGGGVQWWGWVQVGKGWWVYVGEEWWVHVRGVLRLGGGVFRGVQRGVNSGGGGGGFRWGRGSVVRVGSGGEKVVDFCGGGVVVVGSCEGGVQARGEGYSGVSSGR